MTDRATRGLAAICGIVGVLMLSAHFLIPGNVPPDSAGLARIATFARDHRDAILISAWLQVSGAILYVVFILAVVHLAGAGQRFAGRIVALAAPILVGLTLLDSAMIISTVQSAAQSQRDATGQLRSHRRSGQRRHRAHVLDRPGDPAPARVRDPADTTAAAQLRVDRDRVRRSARRLG